MNSSFGVLRFILAGATAAGIWISSSTLFTRASSPTSMAASDISVGVQQDADLIPPIALSDSYETEEDVPLIVNAPGVLGNDLDIDGDPLTAALVDGPVNGALTLNADGSFSYEPEPDFYGTDQFIYVANDGVFDSNPATVTLTINPVNDPPRAVDDAYSLPEDSALNVEAPGVLENDSDPEGSDLTAVLDNGPGHGALALNPDGSFSYTPAPNYNGNDSFSYQACDTMELCATAIVSITVTPVNYPPIANNDATTTLEDQAKTIDVLANDSDPDGDGDLDPGSVRVTTSPEHGSTQVNHDSGAITYTPAPNFNGPDSFRYRVCDQANACDSARVMIDVVSVNDPPNAVDDTASTAEDTSKVINVLDNDSDPDGAGDLNPASVTVTSPPANGSTAVNGSTGAITYTPDPDTNGPDSFGYQVCDQAEACDTAMVAVTITPVNDAPTAVGDRYFLNQDQVLNVQAPGVLENDIDVDNPSILAVLDAQPQHGTLVLNNDGSFTYTPNPGFTGQDIFTYHASDGSLSSATVTVELTVFDTEPPTVEWLEPASRGGRVDVGGEIVTLQVTASDNVGIDRVRFYRWDAVNERHIEIANLSEEPYQVNIDTTTLNDGWNQVFARAYDLAGNISGQDEFIWLYGDYRPKVYLPLIARH